MTSVKVITDDGFDAHHDSLVDLLGRTRRMDVASTLTAVVADSSAPLVVGRPEPSRRVDSWGC